MRMVPDIANETVGLQISFTMAYPCQCREIEHMLLDDSNLF